MKKQVMKSQLFTQIKMTQWTNVQNTHIMFNIDAGVCNIIYMCVTSSSRGQSPAVFYAGK